MPILNTSPTTQAQINPAWYGANTHKVLRQKVYPTQAVDNVPLGLNLPGRCVVLWTKINLATTCGVGGGTTTDATNAANGVCLMMYPTTSTVPVTAPPSTSSASNPTGTNGQLIGKVGSTSSSQTGRQRPPLFAVANAEVVQAVNTSTTEALVTLQPYNTNSNRVQANGTSTTASMRFGTDTSTTTSTVTAGEINVEIGYETWEDDPSFSNVGGVLA